MPFCVAFEDEHLLVVDKPAGLVVHPARGHRTGTLAQALAGRAAGGEDPYRAGIVHRLDRDTSGLLVVAKSDEVHRALKALLAARELRREYLALVEGRPPARTGTIDAPIGRHRHERVLMSIDTDEPREARTHFEIERLLPGATLLRVRAGHRPHPPDPGPHGRHRASGVRRPPVRHGRRVRAASASSCTRRGWRSTHPVTGEAIDVELAAARGSGGGAGRAEADERPGQASGDQKRRRGGPSKAAPPMMLANRATGGRGREVRFALYESSRW